MILEGLGRSWRDLGGSWEILEGSWRSVLADLGGRVLGFQGCRGGALPGPGASGRSWPPAAKRCRFWCRFGTGFGRRLGVSCLFYVECRKCPATGGVGGWGGVVVLSCLPVSLSTVSMSAVFRLLSLVFKLDAVYGLALFGQGLATRGAAGRCHFAQLAGATATLGILASGLATFGGIWEGSWRVLGDLGGILEGLGTSWRDLGGIFEGSWRSVLADLGGRVLGFLRCQGCRGGALPGPGVTPRL